MRELTIATVIVVALTFLLALLFSSPDSPPVTIQAWATSTPVQFLQTTLTELEGTSTSALYGPPYNHNSGSVQSLGGVSPQRILGVRFPLNPAQDFVFQPLHLVPGDPVLQAAVARFHSASPSLRAHWENAYSVSLGHRSIHALLAPTRSQVNPVPVILGELLSMARSGALDAALVSHNRFYTNDYTKPIMFIGDGATGPHADSAYWTRIVTAQHLEGNQWGMMNETGNWPGQPWLWLYTMWYQLPPMNSSPNGDLMVVSIMAIMSVLLICAPFVPILRSIPKLVPIHKLIWRSWYRRAA